MKAINGNAISPSSREEPHLPSRRGFLWAAVALLAGAAALIGEKVLDFFNYAPESGQTASFSIDTPDTFPFHMRNVWIMKDDGGLFALWGTCPHLGCKPAWTPADHLFLCPCHKSVFAADGSRVRGPAPTGLKHLRMDRLKSGRLRIDPRISVPDSFRLPPGPHQDTGGT